MNNHRPFSALMLAPLSLMLCLLPPDAHPQSGQASDDLQAKDLDAVQVQVQAEYKRNRSGALGERPVLDTPFSIATADSEQIEERQIAALDQVFFGNASVAAGGSSYGMWSSLLNVRGLSLDYSNSNKINGMPFYSFGVEMPMEMFEQVQLLKGAGGFMYGFGAPGGIVHYVTKRPTESRTLSVDVGYRSDSVFSEHVDAGGRFGADERFGYRLNASNEQGDVYYGSRLDRQAAAASFDARLGDTLTWTADLLYQRRRIDQPIPYIAINSYTGSRLLPATDGERRLAADASFGDTRFGYGATGLRWQIDANWQARLDVSVVRTDQRFDQEYFYLYDYAGNYGDYTFTGHNINRFAVAQALLEGRFRTGPVEHHVVAGISHQDQQVWAARKSNWTLSGTGNLYQSTRLDWHPASDGAVYKSSDYRQHAAFVSDTLAFTPRWSLLAGLRYTDYRQRGFTATGARSSQYRQSPTTPTAALIFKPRADATLYASYVESLEQGSTVGSTYANAGEVLPPLKSKQGELGAKIERDGWAASAALFRIQRGATYTTADNRYVQDGEIRYQGLELEGRLHPAEGWTVAASALLMDADYQRTSAALAGKRPGGVARRVGTLSLERVLASIPGLSLHTDLRATGPMRLAPGSTLTSPGYLVANAGTGYRLEWRGHPLTLRAEVQNLFDRRYWQGGNYLIQLGAPRTLALNAKVDL